MKLARQRCIYCDPQTWEKIRRRARKARMPVSRFVVLCCLKADEEGTAEPVQPSGHPLVVPPDRQRRLYDNVETIWRAGHVMLDESGKTGIGVLTIDVLRFLQLTEPEEEE